MPEIRTDVPVPGATDGPATLSDNLRLLRKAKRGSSMFFKGGKVASIYQTALRVGGRKWSLIREDQEDGVAGVRIWNVVGPEAVE